MYLENGRALVQGIMLLVFAAIAYWVSPRIGLALVVFMGGHEAPGKQDRLVSLGSPLEADGLEEEAANQKLKGGENHVVPHHSDPHSGELP